LPSSGREGRIVEIALVLLHLLPLLLRLRVHLLLQASGGRLHRRGAAALVGEAVTGSARTAGVGGGEKLRQETMIVLVINRGIGFSFLSSRGAEKLIIGRVIRGHFLDWIDVCAFKLC
jgi:hypothetical protein